MAAVFFGIFGLAIGSFINVIAIRYRGEGRLFDLSRLDGRSHCPKCNAQLKWYELIPVISFIIQGGRCRSCGKAISWQYPIVELITAGAFLLPLFYFYPLYSFPTEQPYGTVLAHLWLAVALCMILLSVIDLRLMIIPDQITLLLAALGVVFAALGSGSFLGVYASIFPFIETTFISHILGGVLGFVLLDAVVVLSRGRAMGMGDVKLAGAMGLILGFPDILFALALAFVAGGAWSAAALLLRRVHSTTMVPFGPFLVFGFWAHVFWSARLVAWYFSLI